MAVLVPSVELPHLAHAFALIVLRSNPSLAAWLLSGRVAMLPVSAQTTMRFVMSEPLSSRSVPGAILSARLSSGRR